jgi:uncharacterized pyridoxamine 5'-phosphate oxidase family protein
VSSSSDLSLSLPRHRPEGERMTDDATSWDKNTPGLFDFDPDVLEEFIATSDYCFMARLRRDGHPVGVYNACSHENGETYVITNVYRQAYAAIKRDPRITVVFAKHDIGEVTIIGRGEIVDDYDLVRAFFLRRAPENTRVKSGEWTIDQFMAMACSKNRRLIRVIREKVFSIDMSKLPWSDDD